MQFIVILKMDGAVTQKIIRTHKLAMNMIGSHQTAKVKCLNFDKLKISNVNIKTLVSRSIYFHYFSGCEDKAKDVMQGNQSYCQKYKKLCNDPSYLAYRQDCKKTCNACQKSTKYFVYIGITKFSKYDKNDVTLLI